MAAAAAVAAVAGAEAARHDRRHDPRRARVPVIGIWYFLDTTLGLTMPDIEWDNLWPILLIAIGGVIVFRAATDRNR